MSSFEAGRSPDAACCVHADEVAKISPKTIHNKHLIEPSRRQSRSTLIIQRLHPQKPCRSAQLLFNPQELVVLRNAVGARGGAGLDLSRSRRDRKLRDERELAFARPMR